MNIPKNKEEALKAMQAMAMEFNISPAELSSLPTPSAESSTKDTQSIKAIREKAREFASGNDLFLQWYFGEDAVNDLETQINNARRVQGQNRSFIGVVQATMMGKTRLLLEASKRTPIILIRLDNSNVVYERLLVYVAQEKAKITRTTPFLRWRSCNRRVLLYIRAFFLSYMLYAREYKNTHEKRLFVPEKLREVQEEICLFNASLLNGGQFYVRALFDREVEQLRKDLTEADDNDLQTKVRDAIRDRHDVLSSELARPTLAIDECHMPLSEAVGMLFHSDYENWRPEDVLGWQRYEFFRTPGTTTKKGKERRPMTYRYGKCGPTTLFSGVRWILQDYLMRPGVHQTTIFTSTFFSVWEPLMDTSKYSRGKPTIKRVYLRKMLTCEDILNVIETIEKRDINGDERRAVRSAMSVWCGRPGFFFDHFLPHFRSTPSDTPLLEKIMKAHEAAETTVFEDIFTDALQNLRESISIKLEPESVPLTGNEFVHFLYYCHRLRGGNINCLSSAMAKLVSAGFAIVQEYRPGQTKKSVGMVAEPLVRKFLDSLVIQPDAYAQCDRFIANEIRRASGTSFGNVAELAIANQIIEARTKPLRELLHTWGLELTLGKGLDGMSMRANSAASIDDLPSSDPTGFFLAPLWHITLPRDGIVMPDVSFFASNQSRDYCLVTIQSKATSSKLDPEEFDGAIRSTSVHGLFTKRWKSTAQAELFRNRWTTFLKDVRSVRFVRVIICTCGWTGPQRAAVSEHNRRHPEQPILLADAAARVALFGKQSAKALDERVGSPQGERADKGTPKANWVIPATWSQGEKKKGK